jgi:hypothetical protein
MFFLKHTEYSSMLCPMRYLSSVVSQAGRRRVRHAIFSVLNSTIRNPHSEIRTKEGQLFMDDTSFSLLKSRIKI